MRFVPSSSLATLEQRAHLLFTGLRKNRHVSIIVKPIRLTAATGNLHPRLSHLDGNAILDQRVRINMLARAQRGLGEVWYVLHDLRVASMVVSVAVKPSKTHMTTPRDQAGREWGSHARKQRRPAPKGRKFGTALCLVKQRQVREARYCIWYGSRFVSRNPSCDISGHHFAPI